MSLLSVTEFVRLIIGSLYSSHTYTICFQGANVFSLLSVFTFWREWIEKEGKFSELEK